MVPRFGTGIRSRIWLRNSIFLTEKALLAPKSGPDCGIAFGAPFWGKKYTILKKWGRDGNILGGVLSGPIFANLGRQFDPTPKSFNPGPQFDRIPNIVNPAVVFDRTPEFANPVEFVDRIPKYMKPGGILTQSQKLEKLGAQLDRIQEFINQGEFLTKQW